MENEIDPVVIFSAAAAAAHQTHTYKAPKGVELLTKQ
jgi:hypothetical protein